MAALEKDIRYTFADYYSWDDGKRWELIDGLLYDMSAAPSPTHQSLLGNLFMEIHSFLKGKPCKAYLAPFDVRLFGKGDEERTVLQPDITVVCDRSKIDKKGCNGAPDMVVEILSPYSVRHDMLTKFQLYRQAGVREYWVVNPEEKILTIHLLEDGDYKTSVYGEEDSVDVNMLEGCVVYLGDVFTDL